MATKHNQLIRVVFDVRDEARKSLRLNEDHLVAACDPDEAIDFVFMEMMRQLNRSDIQLARIRICAQQAPCK